MCIQKQQLPNRETAEVTGLEFVCLASQKGEGGGETLLAAKSDDSTLTFCVGSSI